MFFLLIIMGSTDRRAPAGFAPIAIGLGLTLIHLIGIPVTNLSVNPARSTGPAIFVGDGPWRNFGYSGLHLSSAERSGWCLTARRSATSPRAKAFQSRISIEHHDLVATHKILFTGCHVCLCDSWVKLCKDKLLVVSRDAKLVGMDFGFSGFLRGAVGILLFCLLATSALFLQSGRRRRKLRGRLPPTPRPSSGPWAPSRRSRTRASYCPPIPEMKFRSAFKTRPASCVWRLARRI